MNSNKNSGWLSCTRRIFLRRTAIGVVAARLGKPGLAAEPEASPSPGFKSDRITTPASVRQIKAGVLDVGYTDEGPRDGRAALLLHGWPYDIHSFDQVIPLLVSAGFRVIVPYLRGYGTTRFLSDATVRNGQQSALAFDAVALMDRKTYESSHVLTAICFCGSRIPLRHPVA